MNDIILTSQKLYKSYHDGTSTVEVLKGVDLAITKGDRIAIIGHQVLEKVPFCICWGAG